MHMDVATQVLRPGVQHQGESSCGAEPARVRGELAERGRRALHQHAVHPARVELRQGVEDVRQREDQVAVRYRQQLGQLGLAPGVAGVVLALWAMPVATGVEQPLFLPAPVAALQLPAQRRRATSDDGSPGTRLRRAQRVIAQIIRSEAAQHLGQVGAHYQRSRDGSFNAAGTVVVATSAGS